MTFLRKTEGGLLPKRAEDGGGHAFCRQENNFFFDDNLRHWDHSDEQKKGEDMTRMEGLLMHSFSLSHWSVEKTIVEFVADLLARHVLPLMKEKGLDPETQKWVLLWDCYSVHRCESLLARLKGLYKNLIVLFVPASCTSQLQPLYLTFNSVFKCILASLFALWMSNKAKEQLLAGVQCDSLKFDFRLSAVRVPFITWVHSALKKIIASKQNALSDGWVKSGISVCWPVSPEAVDERDALYDNARALQREGKLFVVKGGKSKDCAVDGVLTQTVLNPARARKASRSQDNDVDDDDESDASQESAEDVNDPMYDDMLRELEVVEEEE